MRKYLSVAVTTGLIQAAALGLQPLSAPTAAGWQAYVSATEARVARQGGQALTAPESVNRGQVLIERVQMPGPSGEMEVPDALVMHWRGVILIPGARLDDVMSRLEREPADTRQQDVLASTVLGRGPGWLRMSLRVHRSLVLSAVFDTVHETTFRHHSPTRASSQSTATKIVEIDHVGTPREREKRPDEDRGLLWRWHAYWRYEQVERGVLVECESVTLSRELPTLLKPIAKPLVNGLAKGSMERTLTGLRVRFRVPAFPLPAEPARTSGG